MIKKLWVQFAVESLSMELVLITLHQPIKCIVYKWFSLTSVLLQLHVIYFTANVIRMLRTAAIKKTSKINTCEHKGCVFWRPDQVWAVRSQFFIVSGMKVSRVLIVPKRPMLIQKHSRSEVCKACAVRKKRVASHCISQSNALFTNDSVWLFCARL